MSKKHTLNSFIASLPDGYADRYDYSQVVYTGNKDKIAVRCKYHDHVFMATPNNHLRGKGGCPLCKGENVAKRNRGNAFAKAQTGVSKKGAAHYRKLFVEAHGGRYVYDWGTFTTVSTPMRMECTEHGEFWQTPSIHRQGSGCPECYVVGQRTGEPAMRTKLETAHPSLVFTQVPAVRHALVAYICPTHGAQTGFAHSMLGGHGCIECGWDKSVKAAQAAQTTASTLPVRYLQRFIEAHGFDTVLEYSPDWMGRKSLDLYVPEAKFAIEFNGAWCHHSSPESSAAVARYARKATIHKDKWAACKAAGVKLLQIWDFKWDVPTLRGIYLHKILHRLGLDTRVYARKCKITEITTEHAKAVHAELSLEGKPTFFKNTRHYALVHEGVEVMWMSEGTVMREGGNRNELIRMATRPGVTVVGGVSKLMALCPKGTIMFTTNDTGSVLPGGVVVGSRYWWYHPASKRLLTRAQAAPKRREKENGEPHREGEGERQFMERHGWVRVWDSGLTRYTV